jgi:hypothetical protein
MNTVIIRQISHQKSITCCCVQVTRSKNENTKDRVKGEYLVKVVKINQPKFLLL